MISPVSQGGEPTDIISTNISSVTSSGNILSGTMEQPIMNRSLYGIEQRLTQLEEKLFDFEYEKRRIVGIVGMPGIGKTTIAKVYYKKWRAEEEFFVNEYISGNQEPHWLNDTLLMGKELNDEARIFTQKFLVVFDDVSQEQVDFLLQNRGQITDGSKIVITTGDKSLIKLLADDIYVVPGLNDKEALQLFKHHAFDNQACSAKGNFQKLSKGFVEYVEGNPRALKELGKEIFGKNEGQWEERLKTLPYCCNPTILTDLSISYEKLTDPQKDAFLDIACFFRSEEEDYVKCLLDPYNTESTEVVKDLADKLLICISAGRIEMPNLLCTVGKELSSFNKNKLGERMWNHEKTMDTLWLKKEQNKVRGIFLDMSKFRGNKRKSLDRGDFIKRFNPQNMRYLKIYDSFCHQQCEVDHKVTLPEELDFPFQEIRYLHWQKFPLKKLPLDFTPDNLIDLRLPYSQIETVWEAAKEAPHLKWVDLSFSTKLINLKALSKAFSLQKLNLEGCKNLVELPREMKNMRSLVFMNLRGCVMLSSLPANLNLFSLKTLILSGCKNFKKFDLNSENLEFLHLDECNAIRSLPKSIKNFQKLVLLNLKECEMLESLPYYLYKLKALEELILSGCILLRSFPDIKENMEKLQILLLDRTSIEEVPNILLHCVKFKDQVICQQPLRMNGVSLLRHLCLSRNKMIRTLGASISQLYQLKWIDLKYCENLLSISSLPPNLQCLDAHDCISLETVASPLALFIPTTQQVHSSFIFTNCEKIDQAVKNEIVCYACDKSHLLSEALNRHNKGFDFETLVNTCFPGNEVPAWFSHRAFGAELKPELPGNSSENGFVGIALCAIVSFQDYKTRNNDLQLKCRCQFDGDETSSSNFNCQIGGLSKTGGEERLIKSTHVIIGYTNWLDIRKCQEEKDDKNKEKDDKKKKKCVTSTASITFEVTDGTNEVINCAVLKCGFSLVYKSGSWKASSETECVSQGYCRIS